MWDLFDKLGIYSVSGPCWASQVEALCAELGEDSKSCQIFRRTDNTRPFGATEVSLKVIKQLNQQSYARDFVRYNPYWGTNGWYTEAEPYDLLSISVPVSNFYVQNDFICNDEDVKAVIGHLPGIINVTYKDSDHRIMQRKNDRDIFFQTLAALRSDFIEATCPII